MARMLPCQEMDRIALAAAFDGVKVPHGIANPVLSFYSGALCTCYLVYAYTRQDLERKVAPPPSQAVFMDMATGTVLGIERCQDPQYDANNAESRKFYSASTCGIKAASQEYLDEMHSLYEQVCEKYCDGYGLDMDTYQTYLSMLYAITPVGYCKFYRQLEHRLMQEVFQ